MRRSFEVEMASTLYIAAYQETCRPCGRDLVICEHRVRFVQRCDDLYRVVRQFKWCPNERCSAFHKLFAPLIDLRLVLPRRTLGTDVILEVGERHLSRNEALSAVGRDLTERGILVSQTTTGQLLRAYIGLAKAMRGDEEAVRRRLRAQGGMVLMADGVQYDGNSPVLYLVWDALSGEPLFGERKVFRGADDLIPLLERVKAMDVPVIAAVSDKEKGLLPAMSEVFPDVPHQLCQLHFLKNCALGMADDLVDLGESVARRAEKVQKVAKRLHVKGHNSIESEQSAVAKHTQRASKRTGKTKLSAASPKHVEADTRSVAVSEQQVAAELCAMAKHAARAAGRAPLNPPELVRHEKLESVRAFVQEAKKKRATTRS